MLSLLIIIPILTALIIGFLPTKLMAKGARKITLIVTSVLFLGSLILLVQFNPSEINLQFQEQWSWIESIGLTYSLGIDGLSMPLLVLNGLLTVIAVYCTDQDLERPRFYYTLILLLNAGVAGAFLAQDLLLFFIFYELELIPLYLLIAIWGGKRRGYAATKFLLYTAASGALVLGVFLGVVFLSGANSFAYENVQNLASLLPVGRQLVLLIGILIAFGIKIPLVPFHTWLPDAHVEASTPISMLLAGVLLKLGTYGLLRFGLGLFSEAWIVVAP